jgi:hypothetical protein
MPHIRDLREKRRRHSSAGCLAARGYAGDINYSVATAARAVERLFTSGWVARRCSGGRGEEEEAAATSSPGGAKASQAFLHFRGTCRLVRVPPVPRPAPRIPVPPPPLTPAACTVASIPFLRGYGAPVVAARYGAGVGRGATSTTATTTA